MRLAVIDIGSNSIKLLVAEPGPGKSIVPLRREKSMVRLGHETLLNEHLSSEAIVVSIRTLSLFKSIAESLGATEIKAVATASVREASNAAAFIREVESRTGIRIEVLSGVEEARLIGLAALHSCGTGYPSVFNIDIGGGSTELSLFRGKQADALHSIKIGAVRLTEQYLKNDPPKPKEMEAMRHEIISALERPQREMKGEKWSLASGTSGTINAIGAALQSIAYPEQENTRVELPSVVLKRDELVEFNEHMASIPAAERKKLSGISEQRAEIIIAGGAILEETMRAFKIARLRTCGWSLREGVLLERFAELGVSVSRHDHEFDTRLVGAHALGERFSYEAEHGKQVAKLSTLLFDQLRNLHGLKEHDRLLMQAGAMLHDIGYVISHESHHKHSMYLILHSELTGFTDLERLIIANIARYHRKTFPKPTHKEFSELSPEDQGRVWMLGGIVRLADAMDRSHQSRIKDFTARLRGDRLKIELPNIRRCEHEVWAIEKKKTMFEEAFGVGVELM